MKYNNQILTNRLPILTKLIVLLLIFGLMFVI
jgi:hypothetical protein